MQVSRSSEQSQSSQTPRPLQPPQLSPIPQSSRTSQASEPAPLQHQLLLTNLLKPSTAKSQVKSNSQSPVQQPVTSQTQNPLPESQSRKPPPNTSIKPQEHKPSSSNTPELPDISTSIPNANGVEQRKRRKIESDSDINSEVRLVNIGRQDIQPSPQLTHKAVPPTASPSPGNQSNSEESSITPSESESTDRYIRPSSAVESLPLSKLQISPPKTKIEAVDESISSILGKGRTSSHDADDSSFSWIPSKVEEDEEGGGGFINRRNRRSPSSTVSLQTPTPSPSSSRTSPGIRESGRVYVVAVEIPSFAKVRNEMGHRTSKKFQRDHPAALGERDIFATSRSVSSTSNTMTSKASLPDRISISMDRNSNSTSPTALNFAGSRNGGRLFENKNVTVDGSMVTVKTGTGGLGSGNKISEDRISETVPATSIETQKSATPTTPNPHKAAAMPSVGISPPPKAPYSF
ncbi:hypothetical protein BGZ76_002436 [Entomortierella beljakovae]|nr:hypothetical protein BGZ76_002436 [Entomortierella beljakovae]